MSRPSLYHTPFIDCSFLNLPLSHHDQPHTLVSRLYDLSAFENIAALRRPIHKHDPFSPWNHKAAAIELSLAGQICVGHEKPVYPMEFFAIGIKNIAGLSVLTLIVGCQ